MSQVSTHNSGVVTENRIDRNSLVPLYHQLKQALLAQIEQGLLLPGQAIPSERELEENFQVSRITVRRAIDELEQEGYLERHQGKGTFVAQPKIRRSMTRLTSFTQEIITAGRKPGSQLLSFRQEAAVGHIAGALHVSEGEKLWFIERLRTADDEPIGLSQSYLHLPDEIILTREEIESWISLWSLLKSKGIVPAQADETVSAVAASSCQANLLGVKREAPLLLVEGVVYTERGVPIEYHYLVNRADRYKYSVHVTG